MGICSSVTEKAKEIKEKIKEFINSEKFDSALDSAFDTIDKDKTGEIDEKEVKTLVDDTSKKISEKIPVVTEDKVKSALQGIGAGEDGKLKKADFKAKVKEALQKIQ